MEKNHHTKREEVDSYSMQENTHSGLELELHFMPKFFHENGCGTMAPHIHEFYQIIWFRRTRHRASSGQDTRIKENG